MTTAAIVVLTVLGFAGGFALSWIQMRKRIEQRYRERVVEEVQQRVKDELVRRITSGDFQSGKPPRGPDR